MGRGGGEVSENASVENTKTLRIVRDLNEGPRAHEWDFNEDRTVVLDLNCTST